MAVSVSILTAAYHMLKNGVDYLDLGPDHLRGADKTKSVNRLLRKIESLGFEGPGSGKSKQHDPHPHARGEVHPGAGA